MRWQISSKLSIDIPAHFSNVVQQYQDRFFVDMPREETLLVAVYLFDFTNGKANGVSYLDCKTLFSSLGKKESDFSKALYSTKKKGNIELKKGKIYLTLAGVVRLDQSIGNILRTSVYIIKSGEQFAAIKLFEEFLMKNVGSCAHIRLCDSYISEKTLFAFSNLKGRIKQITILTSQITDISKFNAYCQKMQSEMGIKIEVYESKKIHDRYIIFDNNCWVLGGSIKDIGNKDSLIKEVSEISSSLAALFQSRCTEAIKRV